MTSKELTDEQIEEVWEYFLEEMRKHTFKAYSSSDFPSFKRGMEAGFTLGKQSQWVSVEDLERLVKGAYYEGHGEFCDQSPKGGANWDKSCSKEELEEILSKTPTPDKGEE